MLVLGYIMFTLAVVLSVYSISWMLPYPTGGQRCVFIYLCALLVGLSSIMFFGPWVSWAALCMTGWIVERATR